MDEKTITKLYDELSTVRDQFLDRARSCAKISIPHYFPDETSGRNVNPVTQSPHQSFIAQGLQNLVSKSLMALLSLEDQTPFFRFVPDPKVIARVTENSNITRSDIDVTLATIERSVMSLMQIDGVGSLVTEALFNIFIGGNFLLYVPTKGKPMGFSLDKYVISRDSEGNVIRIMTKSCPDQSLVDEYTGTDIKFKSKVEDNELITDCKFVDDKWEFSQELNGVLISEPGLGFAKDECPFIPLTFQRLSFNDYGFGLIEMHYGDIQSIELLHELIVNASIEHAKIIYTALRSAGLTTDDWANVDSGDIVEVNDHQELAALQIGKAGDLSVAANTLNSIEQRLSRVFLQYTPRDAERITAAEVRATITELEQSLGSFYSSMANQLQLPLVKRYIDRAKSGDLPQISKLDTFGITNNPIIITGLKALGRVNDLTKITTFVQLVSQLIASPAVSVLNVDDLFRRAAASLSIPDFNNLIKSKEQMVAEQQQAQRQQLASQAVAPAINGITKLLGTEQQSQQ